MTIIPFLTEVMPGVRPNRKKERQLALAKAQEIMGAYKLTTDPIVAANDKEFIIVKLDELKGPKQEAAYYMLEVGSEVFGEIVKGEGVTIISTYGLKRESVKHGFLPFWCTIGKQEGPNFGRVRIMTKGSMKEERFLREFVLPSLETHSQLQEAPDKIEGVTPLDINLDRDLVQKFNPRSRTAR